MRTAQFLAFGKTLLGTLASQAGAYLTVLLLTRMLGVEQFGRYAAIQATLIAAFGVANLGVGVTATRFVARYHQADPARTGRILGLCAAVSLLSGLAFTLALLAFAEPISALCCLLMTVNAHQSGTLLGFQAFRRLLRAQLLQSATSVVLAYTLVRAYGLTGAILSLLLSAAVNCLYLHLEARAECLAHGIRPQWKGCWQERPVLLEFALPAAASGIIGSASVWGAQMLLIHSESGLTQMGLWSAALSLRGAILLAPGVLNRVSGPMLSSLHDHGHGGTYTRNLWTTAAISTGGALAAALLLLLIGPILMSWFGKDYSGSTDLLPLVFASAVLEAYSGSVSQALVAHGRLHFQLVIISAWAATLLLVAWTAIPHLAASGLALAYLLGWAGTAAGYTLIARKLTRRISYVPASV